MAEDFSDVIAGSSQSSRAVNTTKVRLPFPEINEFRGFVTNELARRQETNFSEPSTPFLKMTSCLSVPTENGGASKYLTLGMHGYKSASNIFDTMYGDKDFVGYTYDLSLIHI